MSALNEICLSKWKAMSEEEKSKYNTTIKQNTVGVSGDTYDEVKYIEHYLTRSGFHQFYDINSNQLIISFQDVTPKELYDICTSRWNHLTKEQRIVFMLLFIILFRCLIIEVQSIFKMMHSSKNFFYFFLIY